MVTERPLTPNLVYRGAREICGAVGVPWKEIATFVAEKGLPAWKIDGRGTWLALHDDLAEWIKQATRRAFAEATKRRLRRRLIEAARSKEAGGRPRLALPRKWTGQSPPHGYESVAYDIAECKSGEKLPPTHLWARVRGVGSTAEPFRQGNATAGRTGPQNRMVNQANPEGENQPCQNKETPPLIASGESATK